MLQQACAPLGVGEEEGDRAAGWFGHEEAPGGDGRDRREATIGRAARQLPLAFAPGQGGHSTAKLEIAQANLAQEGQPLADFGQDIASDHSRTALKFELAECFTPGLDGHLREGVNRQRRGQMEIPEI